MSETINNGHTGANVATLGMCAWCDHTHTYAGYTGEGASYHTGERKLKKSKLSLKHASHISGFRV